MALKPLNSVGGFSVGENKANVVLANGDITTGNANFTGNVAASGLLTDNFYYANGNVRIIPVVSGETGQLQYNGGNGTLGASSNLQFTPNTGALSVGGNLTAANANLGNVVIANYVTGTLTTSAQPNITSLGTLSNLVVSGNADINVLNANFLYGNASGLTAISAGAIVGSVGNAQYAANAGYADFANVAYSVSGANVSGEVANANFASYANVANVAYSVSGANVSGEVANANFASYANVANVAYSVSGSNVSGEVANANYASYANTVIGATQSNITALGTLTGLTVQGTSNLGSNANVKITGGSNGQALITDGNGNLSWGNVSSTKISNGTSNVDIAAANGNITMGVGGTGNVVIVSSSGLEVTGTIGASDTITGANITANALLTAANANIGDLLANTANINTLAIGNAISGTASNVTINANGFITTFEANGDVSFPGNVGITGTANIATLKMSGAANLGSNANVTITGGTSGQALITDGAGNLSWGNVSTSNINNGTSNVSIATANGNITMGVGGTDNVVVVSTGGATVAGNLTAANIVAPTSSNLTLSANSRSIVFDTAGDTLFPGNITTNNASVNTFTLEANIANANTLNVGVSANLGAAANVKITGGSSGQYLQTDGSGNLSWSTVALSNISNGNSNVSVAANGNVSVGVGGTADALVVSSGGIAANVVTATSVVTANVTAPANANLSLNTDAGAMTLSAGGVLSLPGNLSTTATVSAGTVQANVANVAQTLNVANIAANGNVTLGDVANVHIAGGTSGQYLQTDGAGNLSWSTIATNSISNGTSSVSVPAANGNVITAVNGSNVLTVTSSGANITGSLELSGNVTVNNTVKFSSSNANITASGDTLVMNPGSAPTDGVQVAGSGRIQATNGATALVLNDGANVDVAGGLTVGAITGNSALELAANSKSISIYAGNTLEANYSLVLPSNAAQSNGQVLAANTDGTLSWTTISTASISNGTSNVNIPAANGNINLSAAGNANVVVVTGTGLNIAGTTTATGTVTGGNLSTGGILSVTGNANVGNLGTGGSITATGNVAGGNLTTGGRVVATGNVTGGNLTTAGQVSATGNITGGNITANNAITAVSANISGSATIANSLTVANAFIDVLEANVFAGTANSININANGQITRFYANGDVSFPANVVVNSDLTSNANITADYFIGNGSQLTGLDFTRLANGNSNVEIAANGNVTVGVAGNVAVLTVTGTGVNVGGTLDTTGDLTTANIVATKITSTSGNMTVAAAVGNNSVVLAPTGTGVVDVSNVRITNMAEPVAATDAVTKQYVDAVAEGLHVHASVAAATPDTLANITSGTVTYDNGANGVGATLTTTGTFANIDGVAINTAGTRILVKNEANAAHNGIYVYTNATAITRASDFNTPVEMAGGDFLFVTDGNTYNSTGWVMTDAVTTVGTSPVSFTQFSGAGTYSAGSGLTLTGTVFSVNTDGVTTEISSGNVAVKANAQFTTPNIGAATGTSLTTTGNVDAGNLNTGGTLNANGNTTLANANISGVFGVSGNATMANVTITGTLNVSGNTSYTGTTTFANITVTTRANITGNLDTTGNINANGPLRIAPSNLKLSGGTSFQTLFQDNNGNLYWTYPLANGANTEVQFNKFGYTYGDANFTYDTAGNINRLALGYGVDGVGRLYVGNGNVQFYNANLFMSSGAANGSRIEVNGDIVATRRVSAAEFSGANARLNYLYNDANTSRGISSITLGNTLVDGANYVPFALLSAVTSVNVNANGTFTSASLNVGGGLGVSNGNVTLSNTSTFFVGNLVGTVTGNLINGNSNVTVAANGNVAIAVAGTANVLLATDTGVNVTGTLNATGNANVGNIGAAAGAFTANVTAANFVGTLANGISNVRMPAANGNINLSVAGNANVVVVTGTGINVAGTSTVTGNASAGNYTTAGTVTATGNVSGGNLSTAGALSVTGNANVGNIGAASGVFTANVTAGNFIGVFANGNSDISIPSANGNINFEVGGVANVLVLTSTGANITGTSNVSGNASAGNYTTAGAVTATGNITGGNLMGPLANGNSNVRIATANGNVVITAAGNTAITVSGSNTTVAGNLLATANVDATSTTTGTVIVTGGVGVSGNLHAGNLFSGGALTAPNITANSTITAVNANITGTATIATANIGNLVGNSTFVTINANGWISNFQADGNVVMPKNLLVTQDIIAANVNASGNLNITGTATFASLGVTGNITAGNFVGVFANGNSDISIPAANGNINFEVGGVANVLVLTSTGANITGTSNVSGNASAGNYTTAGQITATGNITGGNLMGPLANGNSNVRIASANGNITLTAVGNTTLTVTGTGVNVAGTMNATGNVVGANFTGGPLANGTSNVNIAAAAGNVTVGVNGAANVLVISASGANVTGTANVSGNAAFGANVTVTSNLTAANLLGSHANGTSNVNMPAANGNINLSVAGNANVLVVTGTGVNVAGTLHSTGNAVVANLTTGGTIGATGNIAGGNLTTTGAVFASGNATVGNLSTAGAITATGNITGGNLIGTFANGNSNVRIAANSNVGISVAGTSNVVVVTSTGANIAGTANVSGNLSAGNISTAGALSVTGNITAGNFIGLFANGNTDVAIPAANGNINFDVSGNANVVVFTGTGANIAGTLNATGNANFGNVGTATGVFTANVTTDNVLGRTGNVTVTAAAGNNSIVLTPTGTGTVSVANFRITNLAEPTANTDAATKGYVDGVAQGLDIKASVKAATTANITLSGTQTVDGVALIAGDRVLVKNQSTQSQNGIYAVASGSWTRTTDADTWDELVSAFVFVEGGTTNADTGWVCTVNAGGTLGTTAVTFTQFSGAGAVTAGTGITITGTQISISNTAVTSGSYGNGDRVATFTVNAQGQLTAASNTVIAANAANLTGTTLASSIVTSSLTTVGTLSSLTVSGNATLQSNLSVTATATVGNLSTGGTVTATGNLSAGNISTGGDLSVTGTANTGALNANGAMTVTGNLTAANITANGAVVASTGNITTFVANTANVFDLTVGNAITGTTPNVVINANSYLTTFDVSGNVSFPGNISVVGAVAAANANFSGTLAVTATATVGNLSTGGTVTATGNISGANMVANGTFAANGAITGNSTLSITGNANVGNIGAASGVFTSNISVAGTANVANFNANGTVQLGSNSNVKITGGTSGQYLQTDGTGNLSWTTISTSSIVNGNSNVVVAANGNVGISSAGNANVLLVTGTGVNVAGTANVTGALSAASVTATGNVTGNILVATVADGTAPMVVTSTTQVANLRAAFAGAANTAGTVTTGAQPNITAVGTLTALTVSGNTSLANVNASGTANLATLVAGNANVSGNLDVATALTTAAFTANGLVTLGTVANVKINGGTSGQYLQTDGTGNLSWSTLSTSSISNGTSNVSIATANGNVTIASGGNTTVTVTDTGANVTGTLAATGNISGANLTTGGALSVTGNANVGNIGAAGGVFTANVSAGNLSTGGALSVTGNANVGNIGATAGVFTGNVSAGNVTVTGQLISTVAADTAPLAVSSSTQVANLRAQYADSANTAATVTANAQPNITSVGTLSSLAVTGNVTAGNFMGALANTTSSVSIPVAGGNVAVAVGGSNVVVATATGVEITGVANISGNASAANLALSGSANVTGNVAAGNISTTGTLTANGNISSNANVIAEGMIAATGNLKLTAAGGNYSIVLVPTGTGVVDTSGKAITNVATPVGTTDVATKGYVDSVAQGLSVKEPAAVATTDTLANISGGTVTYDNGANGVGAFLTTTGTFATIDGFSLTANARVLVKNETAQNWNGIYVYNNTTTMTRSTDFNSNLTITDGAFVFIQNGNTNAGSGWVQTSTVTDVGNSNVTFTQFSEVGAYSAGTGLSLNGLVFSIANTGVTANTYGSASKSVALTINAQGQITVASESDITANAAALTGSALATGITTSNLTSVGTLGNLTVSGNASVGNLSTAGSVTAANVTANTALTIGNTTTTWGTVTTTAITANQTIAQFSATGITGVEFFVKGVDSTGAKYSVATVQAVTDGANVDYTIYGGVNLGSSTGTLAVNISGSNIALQVTPASSNSTVWTTQYRLI